ALAEMRIRGFSLTRGFAGSLEKHARPGEAGTPGLILSPGMRDIGGLSLPQAGEPRMRVQPAARAGRIERTLVQASSSAPYPPRSCATVRSCSVFFSRLLS